MLWVSYNFSRAVISDVVLEPLRLGGVPMDLESCFCGLSRRRIAYLHLFSTIWLPFSSYSAFDTHIW